MKFISLYLFCFNKKFHKLFFAFIIDLSKNSTQSTTKYYTNKSTEKCYWYCKAEFFYACFGKVHSGNVKSCFATA